MFKPKRGLQKSIDDVFDGVTLSELLSDDFTERQATSASDSQDSTQPPITAPSHPCERPVTTPGGKLQMCRNPRACQCPYAEPNLGMYCCKYPRSLS
ncbi:hypothetical protein ACFL6U_19450 [Planctomycetota bacterium]